MPTGSRCLDSVIRCARALAVRGPAACWIASWQQSRVAGNTGGHIAAVTRWLTHLLLALTPHCCCRPSGRSCTSRVVLRPSRCGGDHLCCAALCWAVLRCAALCCTAAVPCYLHLPACLHACLHAVLCQVRGASYLTDRAKVAPGPAAFSLLAVDLVTTPSAVSHVARFLPAVRCACRGGGNACC